MKRILLATAGVAVVAVFAATIGFAQPTATTGSVAAEAAAPLPKLPANIKERQRFIVGVKCDAPPFGYINVQGKNAGFDVEIAKWFARYAFGRESRVSYICAPTPAREPLLTTDRADLVISTFTYTADRDTRIDFSRAYYKATGRLLVKNDGPVQSINDIRNRKVATTSGSIYDRWMKKCWTSTEQIVTDSFTNALLAFNQGRADALMWDDTVLVGVAAADRSAKLTTRHVHPAALRDRDQAGERGAEALGRLAARADAEEGHVHVHPQEQRAGAVRDGVLEEHPAAEQHVRLRATRDAERGDRLPVAAARSSETPRSGRDDAAAPLSAR